MIAAATFALPSGASAQASFGGEAEVGANFAFGNTEQTVFLGKLGVSRGDSTLEVSLGSLFAYGEASNAEGESFVNKRSWELSGNADYLPHARVSPFVIGRVLSSFEKRIDRRWEAGGGAKYTFVDSDISKFDLSAALLAEKTTPRDLDAAPEGADDVLARWSWRLRAERTVADGRLTLETTNFYSPEFSDWGSFTVTSRTSAGFQVNERITLKLSFLDDYDSEATLRGARENNDGQVLFSVIGKI